MDYLTYPLFALNCDRKTTKIFYSPADLMAFIKAEGFYNFGHREWITHDRRWDRHGGYTYVARPVHDYPNHPSRHCIGSGKA